MENNFDDDNLSYFSNFDIIKIQNERQKEKEVKEKLDIVRKLYQKTR